MKRPDWLTAANGFTGFRFVCAGMTVEALLNGRLFEAFIWGLVGLLTDFFDGMFAKRGWLGGASELGKILDPIADKVMTFIPTTVLAVVLLLAGYRLEGVALIVALLIVACREIIVALTKKELAKLEGLQSAIESARALMVMQSIAFLGALLAYALAQPELTLICSGMIVSATIVSGWDYRSRLRKLRKELQLLTA